MMFLAQALSNLRPGALWGITDDVLSWLDKNQTQPSDEEIETEVQRLIKEAPRRNATLSRADFKIGLLEMGELDNVKAAMADPNTDPRVVILWEDAERFNRMHPDLLSFAQVMGYSEQQLDQLFGVEV